MQNPQNHRGFATYKVAAQAAEATHVHAIYNAQNEQQQGAIYAPLCFALKAAPNLLFYCSVHCLFRVNLLFQVLIIFTFHLKIKVMITIKALDLTSIAVAAEMALSRLKENGAKVEVELQAAQNLKKQLYKIQWDEDAELMIEELPF